MDGNGKNTVQTTLFSQNGKQLKGTVSPEVDAQEKKTGIWGRVEFSLKNKHDYQNPFKEVDLLVTFFKPDGTRIDSRGFYDGSDTWKFRCMPDQPGEWRYVAWFSDRLDTRFPGTFQCVGSDIPGMISADENNPLWFGCKGGKHVFLRSLQVSDRFFASNWPEKKREAFLDWAAENKYNMLSVASHYLNREAAGRGKGWDTPVLWNVAKDQPNPEEFAKMEEILDGLAARKMIVFPFAGFFGQQATYPPDQDGQMLYLKYTIARLGAYWNILYNVAGPEPLLHMLNQFSKKEIDRWGREIDSLNVSGHLLTVHNPIDENPFIDAPWATYQCLQGPKTVDTDSLYHGLLTRRNLNEPLYAQETLWYGNIYHHREIGREYTDDDLRRNAYTIVMAGATLNFADNNGNSSSGFSGTLDLNERHQDKHDIIKKVWDFFGSVPFYRLSPAPDLITSGYCLASPGQVYLAYLPKGGETDIHLTGGSYQGEWIKGADTNVKIPVRTINGTDLKAPSSEDWLLYLTRVNNRQKYNQK